MIETAIFILSMIISLIILLANVIYKRQKIISILTIEFLNRELNDENRDSYILIKSFDYAHVDPGEFPLIMEENLKNYYYKEAISEYEDKKKMAKTINFILMPILILLILTLVFKYPEFITELFKSNGPN